MTSGTMAAGLDRDGGGSSAGLSAKARPKRRRHLARSAHEPLGNHTKR